MLPLDWMHALENVFFSLKDSAHHCMHMTQSVVTWNVPNMRSHTINRPLKFLQHPRSKCSAGSQILSKSAQRHRRKATECVLCGLALLSQLGWMGNGTALGGPFPTRTCGKEGDAGHAGPLALTCGRSCGRGAHGGGWGSPG
jgi:hypothetical protein